MSDLYKNLRSIDPRMAAMPAKAEGLVWHLPFAAPMRLVGLAWFDHDHAYNRLPLERPPQVTQFPGGVATAVAGENCGAYLLSAHTAGAQVRFRTDSTRFAIAAELDKAESCDHMPATGSAGIDLYVKLDGRWVCLGVTRRDPEKMKYTTDLVSGLAREMRDVIVHLPSYAGLVSLQVGLDEGAAVEAPTPFAAPQPIVWYGTSITQGGCATRPGLIATNVLSRLVDREVINQGYSGSGRGEPEIVEMLAAIQEPALYIIDYTWNVSAPELSATLPRLIDRLHEAHPGVPLLLLSPTPGKTYLANLPGDSREKAAICEAEAARRNAAGDPDVHYFDALRKGCGEDFWECYVDGCHLNDMGFYRLAHAIRPVVETLLKA